jgi:hypothetical protein
MDPGAGYPVAGVPTFALREKFRFGRPRGRSILHALLGRVTWRVSVEALLKP